MIQLQFLNAILDTKDYSPVVLNNIDDTYFSEYRNEFIFIRAHVDKYGNVPDLPTFLSAFPKFEVIDVHETSSYLVEELVKDYKSRKMAETFNKVRSLLLSGNTEEALKIYTEGADTLSSKVAISCVDLFRDTTRYTDYLERMNDFSKYYLTTGFRELDKIIGGIDREEELGIIMARTNRGKSYIMIKMAVAAAQSGLNVGVFSGEMTERKVGYRVDTLLTHINNGYLMHGNSGVQAIYKKYMDELPEKYTGSLKVLTPLMAGGYVGVNTLKAFIEKEHLDILFVDQLSLMDDDRKGIRVSDRISNIIIDLKRLQTIKHIPIIAVSQQNRTKNEDKDDDSIDTTQIAGSDDVGKYATWVIGISRDKKDESILTLQIVKARDGGVGSKLTYCVDLGVGTFQYIPNENDTIDDKPTKQEYEQRYEVPDGEDAFK